MEENKMELSAEQFEQILKKERATGRGQGALIALAAMAAVLIVSLGAFFITKNFINKSGDFISNDADSKASKLWGMVEKHFLWEDRVDEELATEYMYKGLIASLDDPYSTYYTKQEYKDLIESWEGEYSGIGAYVSQSTETGIVYIASPMPGSPAEEAGLLPDDIIASVNGEDVSGLDLNLIVSKIKGPEGTTVDLGIMRGNEAEQIFTIERRFIEVVRVEGKMLDDNIGYIKISDIEDPTLEQFDEVYDSLKAEGMEGLILDLRDNPGGDLNVVIKLADKFLGSGIIVRTVDKNGNTENYTADQACERLPIVALVNENTASAAEILSGSLKEGGAAKVVGTTTFGKGIVQAVYPLLDGSGLKLTESEYFLDNDTKIHGIGVTPDIEIEFDRDAYISNGADNQLDKAVEIMEEELR